MLPPPEQEKDFQLGADMVKKGYCGELLKDSGNLAHLLTGTETDANSDYSIQRNRPYKGTYVNTDYEICDSATHEKLSTNYDSSDIVEVSEYDKPSTRTDSSKIATRYEDMSPTYVWQFITQFIRQQRQYNSSIRLLGETGFDTAAHYDGEDNEFIGNNTFVVDTRTVESFESIAFYNDLYYSLHYLYEAGKRSSIRTHLIAACGWLAALREEKDPSKRNTMLKHSRMMTFYIPYFRHTAEKGYHWDTKAYNNVQADKTAPGIVALSNWQSGIEDETTKCLTPTIRKHMEHVIYLCNVLGIRITGSVKGEGGRDLTPIENYMRFNDDTLPPSVHKKFIKNNDFFNDMFHMLKNMYKVNNISSNASSDFNAIAHNAANSFFDIEELLYDEDSLKNEKLQPIPVHKYYTPTDDVIASLKTVSKEKQSILPVELTDENIDIVNGIFYWKVTDDFHMPISITASLLECPIKAPSAIILSNGIILPIGCDYSKPFYIAAIGAIITKALDANTSTAAFWKKVTPAGVYEDTV